MSEPVTTYVLTFKSRVVDDSERRANLNRFLKAALRAYNLRLVKMEIPEEGPPLCKTCAVAGRLYCPHKKVRTKTRAQRAPKPARPYGELVRAVNMRIDGEK